MRSNTVKTVFICFPNIFDYGNLLTEGVYVCVCVCKTPTFYRTNVSQNSF